MAKGHPVKIRFFFIFIFDAPMKMSIHKTTNILCYNNPVFHTIKKHINVDSLLVQDFNVEMY